MNRVDKYSQYVTESLKQQKMSIRELADITDIEYMVLYNSLSNKKRNRVLRAEEYMKICKELKLDPFGAQ